MTVGGWFDAEDVYGPLRIYETMEKNQPVGQNMLVMGPWYHGQWAREDGDHLGNVWFNAKTGPFYREKIEFPFFEHHLKDAVDPRLPEAYVFETGRNQWREHDRWPPREALPRTLYFHADGKLDWSAPAGGGEAFDEYPSDPRKPVPFIDYFATGMTREYMTDDQRFASTRPDVLVYRTEPLEQDITFAGPFTASLQVSVTGTDADFVVKLIDVYPDDYPDPEPNPKGIRMGSYQQLVRGEPFRGRFRNSFSQPAPFEPGKLAKIEFELPDIYHTFRREHRIMVQVQSSWFPLVDRNPQKYVDIYNARESDFQRATHRIYRSRENPSYMKALVLP
jgi:putative CocE/NonD family hydrolase